MSDGSNQDSDNHGVRRSTRNFETGQVKQSFSNRRTRTVQVERKISKSSPLRSSAIGLARGDGIDGQISSKERKQHEELIARARENVKENNESSGANAGVIFGIRKSTNLAAVRSVAEKREQDEAITSPSSSSRRHDQRRGEGSAQRYEAKGEENNQRSQRKETQSDYQRPSMASSSSGAASLSQRTRDGDLPRTGGATSRGAAAIGKPAKSDAGVRGVLRETTKRSAGGKNTLSKVKPSTEKRKGKLTIRDALDEVDREIERRRGRSLAALKRARERQREQIKERLKSGGKVLREVVVPENITVAELANRMAERTSDVVRLLVNLGITATADEVIDADSAELIVSEFGHRIKRVSLSDVEAKLEQEDMVDGEKIARPPIVTVMGHVDHGKTSLLDAIRKSNVAKSEAGGITQHIGASRVLLPDDRSITFIDTPGHEAFSLMRARGANATDLVVLVVAADDGVKEQTVEAISHAKAAGVPIVVAISKCDLEGARVDVVLEALASRGLLVESLQGDVLCVEVSSHTGNGIDKLLDTILLQSDLLELKARVTGFCSGVVLESRMEKGHGVLASLLVQEGSLHKGDILLAGAQWGRIRVMLDEHGNVCETAKPSHPVQISGLQGHLQSGDIFRTVASEARARAVGEYRAQHNKELQQNKIAASLATNGEPTVEQLLDNARRAEDVKRFPFLVKADAFGTLEVVMQALEKTGASLDGAEVVILHGDVGAINESDISLAAASGGRVLGFNTKPTQQARELAKSLAVDVRFYKVLYELLNEIESLLKRTLAPKTREVRLGLAEIKQVFPIGKIGNIAGSAVLDGIMRRGARARILRGEENDVLHEGRVKFLKSYKEEVREVSKGAECGIAFENFQDFSANDRIECFLVEDVEEARP